MTDSSIALPFASDRASPLLFGQEDSPSRRPRCGGAFTKTNRPITLLFISGTFLLTLSAALIPLLNWVIEGQIKSTVVVDSVDSPSYDSWVSNEGDDGLNIYYDVYLFDIANYENVLTRGEKPKLSQVGPFRYNECFTRHEVSFSSDSNTVSYYQQWSYVFDEDFSAPLIDSDLITQSNLVAHGLKAMVDGTDRASENHSKLGQPTWHIHVECFSIGRRRVAFVCEVFVIVVSNSLNQ